MRPGSIFCVCALNALQNSMMFKPRWPSAGPMGGEGFALPAGTWSLIRPTIFFATRLLLWVQANSAVAPLSPVGCHVIPAKAGIQLRFFDLPEIQLHRRRAAENQHRDA